MGEIMRLAADAERRLGTPEKMRAFAEELEAEASRGSIFGQFAATMLAKEIRRRASLSTGAKG